MKVYMNIYELISHLHERGFTSDFDLRTDSIIWVQERSLLDQEDFLITECHRFLDKKGNEMVVCAIVAPEYLVKGILIYHYKPKNLHRHIMIERKISYLSSCVSDIEDQFGYAHSSDLF